MEPKFERATKTSHAYVGRINGKTYVVPHAFYNSQSGEQHATPIRHAIVTSHTHVQHHNPNLAPEEVARVHAHVNMIHGKSLTEESVMIQEQVFRVTDHKGATHEVAARDASEAKKRLVSGHVTGEQIPMTQWHKIRIETKKLEEDSILNEAGKYRIVHTSGKFINKHGKLGPVKHAVTYDNKQDAAFVKRALITTPGSEHDVHSLRLHSSLDESSLTAAETAKKEEIVKSMKKKVQGFTERYGKNAKSVMYATATKQAKKLAEETEQLDELVKPSKVKSFLHKLMTGATPKENARRIKGETQGMSDHELHSLHKSNNKSFQKGKNTEYGSPQHIQQRAIHREVTRRASLPKTMDKSKFVKKDLREEQLDEVTKAENLPYNKYTNEFVKKHPALFPVEKDKKEVKKDLREDSLNEAANFMTTYKRNESQNRHTENLVHLAKHFGTADHQAEAKFYADELKKHGHQPHSEKMYALHQKLWPKAVKAVGLKEDVVTLEELRVPTLHRYIKMASGDVRYHTDYKHHEKSRSRDVGAARHERKAQNRVKGIQRATDRLVFKESNLTELHQSDYSWHKEVGSRQGAPAPGHAYHASSDAELHKLHSFHSGKAVSTIRTDPQKAKRHQEYADTAKQILSHRQSALKEHSETFRVVRGVLQETMTRKHFQQVADVIKAHPDAAKRKELAAHHAEIFKKSNPRFDHARFYAAANASLHEDVEQLDELKRSTVASYVGKAAPSLASHSYMSAKARGYEAGSTHPISKTHFGKEAEKYEKKTEKREKGIQRASKRLV